MLSHLQVLRQVWAAPGNRGQRAAAVLRAARWFARCHRKPGDPVHRSPVDLAVFGDRIFPCHTDSIIAKHVMFRSEWFDWDLMRFMDEFLRPGDFFLDAGANTGLHTLMASRRITSGKIVCVEALPKNIGRLRRCLEINRIRNAEILPVAAADTMGRARMAGDDVFARISHAGDAKADEIEVDAVRLDAVLPMKMIHFAKLDIEGGEPAALRGLSGHIERGLLPVFVFELNECIRGSGIEPGDFTAWLRRHGYELALYHHDERRMEAAANPWGDVWAVSGEGKRMIAERTPAVRW